MNKVISGSPPAAYILAAVAAVGVVISLAWAESPQAPERGFVWKDGAEVYAKLCSFCHETKIGPAIRGRGLDPLYIGFTVRHGNRAMPAFRQSEIDDESLQKVAEYVSKWKADQ